MKKLVFKDKIGEIVCTLLKLISFIFWLWDGGVQEGGPGLRLVVLEVVGVVAVCGGGHDVVLADEVGDPREGVSGNERPVPWRICQPKIIISWSFLTLVP